MKRIDVASTILLDETRQKIVMVRSQKDGKFNWTTPGGAVEPGETLEQAAIRETKEECGYDVRIGSLHSVREMFFETSGHHVVIFTFYATITGGELEIMDPDGDIVEVCWMELTAANELMTYLPEKLSGMEDAPSGSASYYFQGTL
ncbi:NUDIX hydrolase [Paenibacillus sp. GYB004]|uniref:NUDIX hydrolase n=1 Tax=Paenibacillus sp. GYB004 TaxID=2994393 RepID=UPI002F9665F8